MCTQTPEVQRFYTLKSDLIKKAIPDVIELLNTRLRLSIEQPDGKSDTQPEISEYYGEASPSSDQKSVPHTVTFMTSTALKYYDWDITGTSSLPEYDRRSPCEVVTDVMIGSPGFYLGIMKVASCGEALVAMNEEAEKTTDEYERFWLQPAICTFTALQEIQFVTGHPFFEKYMDYLKTFNRNRHRHLIEQPFDK